VTLSFLVTTPACCSTIMPPARTTAENLACIVLGDLVGAGKGPAWTDILVEITGREVSALGLGCMGMSWGYRPADEKESLNGTPSTSREQRE
jgi:hypothetical protein